MARNYSALVAYLAAREATPFGWDRTDPGVQDCLTYAAGAVLAQSGVDLLAGAPAWTNEEEARRIIALRGGLEAIVDAHLAEVPRAMAMRGDIGAVLGPRGPLLVVIEGDTLAAPGPLRVGRLPRRVLRRAWNAVPKAPTP